MKNVNNYYRYLLAMFLVFSAFSAYAFTDDFSSDTTGSYTIEYPAGVPADFLYDALNERAEIRTGDDVNLQFSRSVTPADTGHFSLDFLPVQKFPNGGVLRIFLMQDQNNYYEFKTTDGYAPGELIKVVNGVTVSSTNLVEPGYIQNLDYPISIDFSPLQTTVNAIGQTISISSDTTAIVVQSFAVRVAQQDAYIDNINYEALDSGTPLPNQAPVAANDPASTQEDTAVDIPVLANDSDIDGSIDAATVVITGNALNGSTVVQSNGIVTYMPNAAFSGSDSFTYTVEDNEGELSNEASVTVNVLVAGAFIDDFSSDTTGSYTIEYPAGVAADFLYDALNERAEIRTGDNVNLQFSRSVTPADTGHFSLDFLPVQKFPAGGVLRIFLMQDQNNYYEFKTTDGYAPGELIKVVNGVTVSSTNLVEPGYIQNLDYPISIDFSPLQTTVNAIGQTISISSDTTAIVVQSFAVRVAQQDAYIDNINYEALDSGTPLPNQAPVAANDPASTQEDTAVDIPVLANDSDIDGSIDAATVVITGNALNGSTVVQSNGIVTYMPNAAFSGSDSFTYTVEDNEGELSNEASVTVNVLVAGAFIDDFSSDTTGSYTIEYPAGVAADFLYDALNERAEIRTGDNVNLQFSRSVTPADTGHFSLDFLPVQKFPAGGVLRIFLMQDQNNYYEFKTTDGYAPGELIKVVNGVTVSITNLVEPGYIQNLDYPISIDFSPLQTTVNAIGQTISISSDTTAIVVQSFAVRVAQQNAYIDNINFEALDSGTPLPNQAPVAANDPASTQEDTAVDIPVLANDSDIDGSIDAATVVITGNALNGSTVVQSNGIVTYMPNAAFSGSDSFTYTVEDNEGELSNEASVTVSVLVAGAFTDDFSSDTTGSYTIEYPAGVPADFLYDALNERAEIRTGDDVNLQFSRSVTPADTGHFSLDFLPVQKFPNGGVLRIFLMQDQNNYYEFKTTDGYAPGELIKVVNGVTVSSTNLVEPGYIQNLDYPISIDFSPLQTTVNAIGQTISISSDTTAIVVQSFAVRVAQQDAYIDNINYEALDSGTPLPNQAPVAANDPASTQEDTAVDIPVLANDSDIDGSIDAATVVITGNALNGSTVVQSNGVVTYTPNAAFSGSDSFTYTVEDNEGELSNEASVTVSVLVAGAFTDDFSSDTTGSYTVEYPAGVATDFLYDAPSERLEVLTGDNIDLQFSRSVTPADTGHFSLDFLPVQKFPAGGVLRIFLMQDQNNYYEFKTTDGYAPGELIKVVNGVTVSSTTLAQGYIQNLDYPISIDFSPLQTTVDAIGQTISINSDPTAIVVQSFAVRVAQQNAYIDNINYEALDFGTPHLIIVEPSIYHLQTGGSLNVKAAAYNLDPAWAVKFVLDQGGAGELNIIDTNEPFEAVFTGVNRGEHTVDAYIIDSSSDEISGDSTHDRVNNIGIGDYYIVMGDSITFGVNDDIFADNVSSDFRNSGGGFAPILNDLLTLEKGYPHTVVNKGVPGAVSADGVSSIQLILAEHPGAQYVLVEYGTNDSAGTPLPSGIGLQSGDEGYSGTYKDHMQQIIDAINDASKKVLLAKIPYILGSSSSSTPYPDPEEGYRNLIVQEYNLVIEELVYDLSNNIDNIPPDFYNYFRDNYQLEYSDNLHPNGIGYNSMAELWLYQLIYGAL